MKKKKKKKKVWFCQTGGHRTSDTQDTKAKGVILERRPTGFVPPTPTPAAVIVIVVVVVLFEVLLG